MTGPLAIAIGGQDRLFPTACYFDDNPACSFFYDVHHGTVNTMCEGNTIDGPYVPSHLSAGPHSVYIRLVSVHDAYLSVPCAGPCLARPPLTLMSAAHATPSPPSLPAHPLTNILYNLMSCAGTPSGPAGTMGPGTATSCCTLAGQR